jgi:methylated-DNA-[protein]-cysteine S-methyltransferase
MDLTPWPPLHDVERGNAVLALARQQLEEYFARTRTTFDLPLEPAGSAFQRHVWDALRHPVRDHDEL